MPKAFFMTPTFFDIFISPCRSTPQLLWILSRIYDDLPALRWGGRGGGGVKTFLAIASLFHATLWELLLHLHSGFMQLYEIFSCTCTPVSCYATWSPLALARLSHATLWDLLLHLHVCVMQLYESFSCTCAPLSCNAMRSSLKLARL